MKKAKRWLLMTVALLMLVTHAAAVAPFKKVSIATSTKSPVASSSTAATATEAPTAEAEEAKPSNVTASATPTKNSKLTGIPQIDYIWDPNLPRELNGYNLSTYPFHSSVPPADEIHFKCDGLHDGFYASIEHKCQVYHHCVYGIRHDFLCANFTAFDQKTFICHFASDVDCAGSQKYWSRNDALYMATTTSSTTTTTTEPPPTPRRRPVRPLRPLRRPLSHRNSDDYYYEDEQEYDDDYYDELVNRRRKQRPRQRKPMLDDYSDYEDNKRRRPASRNRFRDEEPELEDDYDTDRRKYDRSKSRNNNPERTGSDRRKIAARKPTTSAGRTDERRSFSDDRPLNGRKEIRPRPAVDDLADAPVDTPPRRLAGRRRINEKRTSPTPATAADFDDLDEYEKPKYPALDQEEAADEEAPPKIKTTPNEFVTPKAAPASVYARPRAPPRIARPVPVNEKKKFQYTAQKAATTAASLADAHPEDEEYYEDAEYDDAHPQRGHARRRIVEDSEDDVPATKRRNHNEAPPLARKPTRNALRKPITDKKALPADDADYDSAVIASNERLEGRGSARKRPFAGRTRGPARDTDDVDFVDDDYDERQQRPAHRLRPKPAARKGAKKPRLPLPEEEEEDVSEPVAEPEQPVRSRPGVLLARRKPVTARLRQPTPAAPVAEAALDAEPQLEADAADADADAEGDAELPIASSKSLPTTASGRTASVRVVKRPFLPSRGGSPYLPRGLQPVGVALKPLGGRAPHTTDSTPIDMGSTISGVRLLEHGAPILRDSGAERTQSARTTLPPRSAIPVTHTRSDAPPQQSKISLDELYETDYDVTLNDALNPTLKPLSPLPSSNHQNRNYAAGARAGAGAYASAPAATHTFVNNNQSPAIYHNNNNNNNNYQLQQQQLQSQQLQRQQQQHHSNAYQSVPHQPPSQPLSQSLTQPLSQSQSQTHHQQLHTQSPPQAQQQQQQQRNNYNSDSYFSSTDIRRRAVIAAPPPRTSQSQTDYRGVGTRIAQHFYDDFEY